MPKSSSALLKQLNTKLPILTPNNPEIIQFLQAGHKMNEPSPLFARIEQARVDELKQLFAGKQSENGKVRNVDEADIAQQADKVRKLKASGVGKEVWQPEVNILLDLKRKFEAARKHSNGLTDIVTVKNLEEEIEKQVLIIFAFFFFVFFFKAFCFRDKLCEN